MPTTPCAARALIACLAAALAACAADGGPAAARPAPLAIAGDRSTLELAPALVAADALYGSPDVVMNGCVRSLGDEPCPQGFKPPQIPDVATNAETQTLRWSVSHPDTRIIFTVTEGLYRIVARRSSGIATLADLKGKRIATIANTSAAYYIHRMLATAGLSDADVTVVSMTPLSRMPAALASGEVDAVTIWQPESENAARAIGGDAVIFQDNALYRELFNLNTTAGALADPEKREAIVEYLRALIQASERIEADPSVAWPYASKATGYAPEVVARSWEHHAFPAGLVPDALDVLEAEEQWLAPGEGRAARSRSELAKLIDASVAEEAKAGMRK